MKYYPLILFSCLLFTLMVLGACNGQEELAVPQDSAVTDLDSLVESLQANGATVEKADPVSQPFFKPQGQVLVVNGQDVQVFEYDSEASANAEADLVAPDGSSVGTSIMTWIATPHFYKSGKLIVLYVGDQDDTINVLEAVLGTQFAGG